MGPSVAAPPSLVLSCEHATARVPAPWRRALAAQLSAAQLRAFEAALGTHAGVDFGALQLARQLARHTGAPLLEARCSRLLVDCNRSAHHPRCLSAYAKRLAPPLHRALFAEAYLPHRRAVLAAVQGRIARGGLAVHLAVHSFTPKLNGTVRPMDVGVLFDPARPLEARVARSLVHALRNMPGAPVVRRNAPYRGTADGLPTALRALLPTGYVGIELEINQAWALGPAAAWRRHRRELVDALNVALQKNF